MLALTDSSFKVSDSDWREIEKICEILFDCHIFTKSAQSNQMTMSDFYILWKEMKLKLEKKEKCNFLDILLSCIEQREKVLLENATMLSALYLDPRYRKVLNDIPSSKQAATNHLTRLWKRIQDLTIPISDISEQSDQPTNSIIIENSNDDLDNFLDSFEGTNLPQSTLQSNEILLKLQQFDNDMNTKKRLPRTVNINKYWEEKKNSDPELFQLASVIFGVASAQTSVERNFSALTFILNRYRCNLSDENLEDILFIRTNKELFLEIIS